MNHAESSTDQAAHSVLREPKAGRRLFLFLIPIVLLVGGAVTTLHLRASESASVKQVTQTLAIQHVTVVHAVEGRTVSKLDLPGTTEAFVESPIFARTDGYLKTWKYDIGARVHAGDCLAVIETPELNQQLAQARAALAQTEADLKLAQVTAARYQDLIRSHSVSQQEVDQNTQNQKMLTASRDAAAANEQRLEQLVSYENVYAPFDGVITARNTDVGDLINAGSNGPGKELFRLARIDMLRIYVTVPEDYSAEIRPGMHADLHIAQYPGKTFPAIVARYATAIDPSSRTMRTELDIPNGRGLLLPGAFASATFDLKSTVPVLTIPSNTLLFQEAGMQVGVVDPRGRVQLHNITIGRDLGTSVEVLSGINVSDPIIANPSDSLTAGTQVSVENGATTKGGN